MTLIARVAQGCATRVGRDLNPRPRDYDTITDFIPLCPPLLIMVCIYLIIKHNTTSLLLIAIPKKHIAISERLVIL